MKKFISFILIMCCLFSTLSAYAVNEKSAFTQVAYNGTGTSYYELDVPAKMAPGDTGTVSLSGTWEASRQIKVYSDGGVLMKNSSNDEDIYLEIYFDGINAPGNNVNPISVSKSIDIDFMDHILFGTWNGVFNYYVDVLDSQVNNGSEHSGVIPYGGTYYVMATGGDFETGKGDYSLAMETLAAGDEFPDTVNDGDVYVYGDYEYRYNYGYEGEWFKCYCDGWGATVVDNSKSSYSNMLQKINGENITNAIGTYRDCTRLKYSPAIPLTVIYMDGTYYGCTSLAEAPAIHNGVVSLASTFYDCSSIKEAPELPLSVTYIGQTFWGCTSLTVPPVIHENITEMYAAFAGCSNLTGAIEINSDRIYNYLYALIGTNITEITGTISDSLKAEILATKYEE